MSDWLSYFVGLVYCHGAYWRADSTQENVTNLKKGDKVEVVGRDGLTLHIQQEKQAISAV